MTISKTIILVVAMVSLEEACAARDLARKFGRPVLAGENLVFAEAGRGPHRLICITKEDGRKLWEITDAKQKLQPWLVLSNQLIVTTGGDINDCDPSSGKLTLRYRTGYQRGAILKDLQDGYVLIQGEKDGVDYLSYVEAGSWRVVWGVARIALVIAPGQEVLLCEQGARETAAGGSYSLVDQRCVAVSRKDGKVLWSCPLFAQGAAIDSYFLVYLKDTIRCLNQRDGATLKQFRIAQTPYAQMSFATKDQQLLVNTFEFSSDFRPQRTFFSLTVPGLEWSKLTEREWDKAVAAQLRVRGDNYIYASSIETDGSNTTITRTEISTGKRKELYREPVPAESHPKPVGHQPKQ